MRRRRAGRDQRGANRGRLSVRRLAVVLYVGKRLQQACKRAFRQRPQRVFAFMVFECLDALRLEDSFGLVGKNHRIAIESDTDLVEFLESIGRFLIQQRSGDP
ncbi:hypothetical protein D9M68_987580 [compost metagenome]